MTTSSEQALARRLADFERRIKGLERGDRLTRASVVVDDTGRSLGVTAAVVTGSREAALIAARALVPLLVQGDPVGQSIWFTDSEPVGAITGDLWLRAELEPTLAQYAGGTWTNLADQTAAPAVAGLRSGIATDDGRIVVWSNPTAPSGTPAFGDLWLQATTVAYRWEGDAGWQPLVAAEGQSLNYVAGEDGWTITPDGDSQFKDIAALGNVAGVAGSFDSLDIGGTDVLGTLSALPKASRVAIRGAPGNINAGPTSGTTELRFFTFNAGPVKAGNLYNVIFRGLGQGTAGDVFWGFLHYTTDGSEPTISSPIMAGGQTMVPIISAGIGRGNVNFSTFYPCDVDGELRLAVSFQRLSGTGTLLLRTDSASFTIQAGCTDLGLAVDADTALQQTAKVDGSGSDNPPIITYTKTIPALWAHGVDVNGNTVDSYFSVGNSPFGSYGAYGLVGWDSAAIIAALTSSVTPIGVTLRWRARSRLTSAGLDVRIHSHNYASRAAAIAAVSIAPEDYTADISTTLVASRSNAAPNIYHDQALGVSVFNQFKTGTRKGVVVANNGPQYSSHPDGTGTIYGNGAYEMQLIFTYQGTG